MVCYVLPVSSRNRHDADADNSDHVAVKQKDHGDVIGMTVLQVDGTVMTETPLFLIGRRR
jgi:hypothetical protein